MNGKIPADLYTLEMANNHMGDLDHGLHIIKTFGEICKKYPFSFAFKLQYRELDSFIHPDMKGRDDVPYIKRFSETRLTRGDLDTLVKEIRNQGFLTMATPFDEKLKSRNYGKNIIINGRKENIGIVKGLLEFIPICQTDYFFLYG